MPARGEKKGLPGYVYILFEHKSYQEHSIAFHILRYMVKIWEKKEVPGNQFDIKARVVHGGSEENDKYFAATPSGELELGVLNSDAAAQLVVGQEYYLDLTLAAE